MFDLYIEKAGTKIIKILLIIIVAVGGIWFTANQEFDRTVLKVVCFAAQGIVYLVIFLKLYFDLTKKPYSEFLKYFSDKPDLVKRMEQEFNLAENIENKIWIGEHFVYIKGDRKFVAGHKSQIENLRCSEIKVRYGTTHYLSGKCEKQPFRVDLSEKGQRYVYERLNKFALSER